MKDSHSQLTLSQIAGALTVGQIWAFWLAISASVTAVASFAFWFGQQTAVASENEKLSKSKTEILIQTERAQQATEKLKQYAEYVGNLNAQIAERNAQIVSLNERLGRTNTCRYLQQQISSLEQQISKISSGNRMRGASLGIFDGNEEAQKKRDELKKQQDDAELSQLQQRILAYSQQLSACAK